MAKGKDSAQRYYPYLLEIRNRLLFIAALFIIASAFGFIYYETIIRFVLKIFNFEGVNIVFTSPFQFIELSINSGLLVGVAVIFPLIIFQVMSFLRPALSRKEMKLVVALIPISIFLFIAGFSFGIFIMRYVISIFYERAIEFEVGNFLDISLLLSQTLLTALLMGVAFQFPIVLTILMRLKITTYKVIKSQRILAYASSIIFAAILPPTDLLSLVLLTLPLVILFEFTLLLNKLIIRDQ